MSVKVYVRHVHYNLYSPNAVTPLYFWTLQKIFNKRIHGSNAIAAHGKIKAADGGLQLNGEDAWLDAGDFYGQCLGDPDLCIKGFSFGLQVTDFNFLLLCSCFAVVL